ncbi:MAG: tetratricopeptide repeat protein [Candidatus Cloacimonetes bacterium]|nr:tetratricopeptide repeat protein [Candidatus Cloacimonadota bacterium]
MKKRLLLLAPLWILFFVLWLSPFWRLFLIGYFYETIGNVSGASLFYMDSTMVKPAILFPHQAYLPHERIINIAEQAKFSDLPDVVNALVELAKIQDKDGATYQNAALQLLVAYSERQIEKDGERVFFNFVKSLQDKNTNSSIPYYLLGKYFLRMERRIQAQEQFREALNRIPFLSDAALLLAKAAYEEKNYTRVIQVLETHKTSLPDSFDFYSMLGLSNYFLGHLADAAKPLEEALKIRPASLDEARALGLLGAKLGFDDYARHLRDVIQKSPEDRALVIEYSRYLLRSRQYAAMVEFFLQEKLSDAENVFVYAQALFHLGRVEDLENLADKHEELALNPHMLYFRGMLSYKNGKQDEGVMLLEDWLETSPDDQEMRRNAYQVLALFAKSKGSFEEERRWLTQHFRLDPSRTDLMVEVSRTYDAQGDKISRMRSLLESVAWYPDQPDLLLRATKLLYEFNAYFRLIELLQQSKFAVSNPELGFLLILAYIQVNDISRAQSHLQKLERQFPDLKLPPEISVLKDSAFLARRSMESFARQNQVFRENEAKLMLQMQNLEVPVSKSTLPPPLSLAPTLSIEGTVNQDYRYRGQAQTMIPEGEKVPLWEVPVRISEKEREEGNWFLARYQGTMHKIHSRYLDIKFWPSDKGAMGEAVVVNVDEDYETTSEVIEQFKRGDKVQILSSRSVAPEKTIELDEDNLISFLSVPLKSFVVRRYSRVYFLFRKEFIQIEAGLEFLGNYAFQEAFRIPSEEKIVLMGPEEGGVYLFDMRQGQSRLIHATDFATLQNKKMSRNQRPLDRPMYRGSMVIDLNRDDVLDYVCVWQSLTDPEAGAIHIVVSRDGGYEDLILETSLTHIENYQNMSRISPLHFLRDTNEDGRIEFFLGRPIYSKRVKEAAVPFFEWYEMSGTEILDVSSRFPDFYMQQSVNLRDLLEHREIEHGENSYLYQVFYASYQLAVDRLEQLRRGVQ